MRGYLPSEPRAAQLHSSGAFFAPSSGATGSAPAGRTEGTCAHACRCAEHTRGAPRQREADTARPHCIDLAAARRGGESPRSAGTPPGNDARCRPRGKCECKQVGGQLATKAIQRKACKQGGGEGRGGQGARAGESAPSPRAATSVASMMGLLPALNSCKHSGNPVRERHSWEMRARLIGDPNDRLGAPRARAT